MRSFHPDDLLEAAKHVPGPLALAPRFAAPRDWTRRRLAPVGTAPTPAWRGAEEARAAFLARHPGGFAEPAFRLAERTPRLEARRRLMRAAAPAAAAAGEADGPAAHDAVRAAGLLAPEDAAPLGRLLGGPRARAFLAGAARFAAGAGAPSALAAMRALAALDGADRWPVLTCLPFLWRPDRHMLLEPARAALAARRLGHAATADRLAAAAAPGAGPCPYRALLQLCGELRAAVADLRPADNLDLLGLIRTVARPA